MGVLPQVLEIIFELQRKMTNEKIKKKINKLFQLIKHVFLNSFLDPSYFQTS